jgi:putrescine transport system permease protein
MILPLYGSLSRLDESLVEAAADLGARPSRAFYDVILPLSLPGIAAGCLLVFIPAVGEFVIPDLLGGPGTLMIGKMLWQEFFDNVDWPAAAAIAMALVIVLALPLLAAQRFLDPRNPQAPIRGEGAP